MSDLAFRAIPSPPGIPLVGNLHEWLGRGGAEDVLERLRRQAEASGPLLRVPLGPANVLVIADAPLAAAALSDARANHKGLSYILTRAVLDNVLLLNGEEWARHRALYKRALREVDVLGPAEAHTTRFARGLAASGGSGGVDLARAIPALVARVVGDFVAGTEIPEALDPARALVQYELAALGIDLIAQPWALGSPGRWRALRRAVRALLDHFAGVVRARSAGGAARPDVLGALLSLRGAPELPDDDAVARAAVNFFFTAHEVLATAAMWTLELCARHPEVQRELAAALARAQSPMTCPELGLVLREALRLYPAYALFGRTTQAAMTIGGHRVPRGTFLIVSPWVIQRQSRHFPRPDVFEPRRWEGRARGPIVSSPEDQYVPFGVGPRGCLASHLAVPLLGTIVATVIGELALSRPACVPSTRYWGTVHPRGPLGVALRPRGARA